MYNIMHIPIVIHVLLIVTTRLTQLSIGGFPRRIKRETNRFNILPVSHFVPSAAIQQFARSTDTSNDLSIS